MCNSSEGEKFQDQGKITVDVCAGKTKLIGKLTAMIILHFHLQPQFIYELFHVNFISYEKYYTVFN